MLVPRKLKHRKQFRGRMKGMSFRTNEINFGKYALKSWESGWVSARQIEAARRAMTRFIKRNGKIWIRIFPDKPVTKTPNETGMVRVRWIILWLWSDQDKLFLKWTESSAILPKKRLI